MITVIKPKKRKKGKVFKTHFTLSVQSEKRANEIKPKKIVHPIPVSVDAEVRR